MSEEDHSGPASAGSGDSAAAGSLVAAPPGDELGLEASFLTIWLRPRASVRRIVSVDPTYWVVPLAAIGGITQVLSSATTQVPGRSLATILLGAVAGGPLLGIFALYIGAWLMRLTGRWWLHGLATPEETRAALGWANLPHVVALPLWLLATAAFGMDLYTETGGELASRSWVYVLFLAAVLGLQAWGLAIASAGVAEVQGYRSAWKGFWNILLALLLVAAGAVALTVIATVLLAIAGGLVR